MINTSDIFINDEMSTQLNIIELENTQCDFSPVGKKANRFIKKGSMIKKSDLLNKTEKVVIQYGEFISFEFDGKLISSERDAIKIQQPDFKVKKITVDGVIRNANN